MPAPMAAAFVTYVAGRPVEYLRSVYRGDRYRIVSRLKLAADAASAGSPAGHHPGMPPGDLPHGTPVTASTLGDVQG
ncbi:hypothetical protein [Streptomyces glaucescens]|uniref:hypothetical protein n=1 Tax=Streptomyces glaucescens TaxID=1907 RepID=UPI003F543096